MEKARELLLLDQRPSDIYLDLRYQSLSAFSTEFKKHFGISPKQFQSKNTVAGYAY
jgi:AraC-like DNA-binding protein